MLIPLTIFYLSSFIIVVARIIDNIYFLKFYNNGQDITGKYYALGAKASMIAIFFNIVMGLFQVASIIELFFVLGQIKKQAKKKLEEAQPIQWLGIAIAYLLATGLSGFSIAVLIWLSVTFSIDRRELIASIQAISFIILATMLTIVTLLVSIRLYKLSKLDVPINDGRKALIKYYLVFTIGYLIRVIDDFVQRRLE